MQGMKPTGSSAAPSRPEPEGSAGAGVADKRRVDRVAGEIWVKTLDPMTDFIGSTADISADGMFVHCLNPLPAGERCAVSISVEGREAECGAYVVRSLQDGRPGMGIVFHHPERPFTAALAALLAQCGRAGPHPAATCTLRFGEAL